MANPLTEARRHSASFSIPGTCPARPPATPESSRFRTARLAIAALMLLIPLFAHADIIHVDGAAGGNDDGMSWTDAYTDLQDGLADAESGDEIWVAAGIYRPGDSFDEEDTFQLIDGVGIYGGFAGTETQRDQRDPEANITVLSGDISGDDTTNADGVVVDAQDIDGTNSLHVVTGNGTNDSAILDGFTITAGKADVGASGNDDRGGGMLNDGGSPTLTNLVFSGNSALNFGGGMLTDGGTPRLTNLVFSGNNAGLGGGMVIGGDPVLTNIVFSDNSADQHGGALYNLGLSSEPVLTNVTFSNNSAATGGAMGNLFGNPTLTNVVFSGNSAGDDGGGMRNSSASATLTNVTFSGNSAGSDGGGMHNNESSPDIRNTIFWNNEDNSGTGTASASIFNESNSSPTISHSLVQGQNPAGTGNLDGTNTDNNPDFIAPVDPATAPTAAGNLRLQTGSPAIDVGNNDDNDTDTDLAGNVRIVNTTIDLGPYETAAPSCPADGMLFVDRDATQPGDGLSWASAYRDLQDALAVTEACEIWVADGVYKPTDGTGRTATFELQNGVEIYGGFDGTETQRDERDPEANPTVLSGDVDDNDTTNADGVVVDTGDIAGGNSLHVVNGSGTDNTAVLDGFTITAGNADGSAVPGNIGGGMLNDSGNPTLTNVTFSGNRAAFGGGMANMLDSNPTVTNAIFSGNSATERGGGMASDGSSPTLTNVTFSGNSADLDGGGMSNSDISNPTLTNLTFSGNSAGGDGGGMFNFDNSDPAIRNTIFWNNQAGSDTGTATASIVNNNSSATISYSLAQGCNPGGTWNTDCGADGDNNLEDSDPLFVDTPDPSSAPTTAGDVRLLARSPAIDAGNDGFFSDITTATDLDGNDRLFGDSVDLGPFETVYLLLDLSTAGDGQGSIITEEPPRFAPGETVNVEAVPAQSSVFDGWTGDLTSTDNPLVFTINTDTALTANFTLKTFEVTATTASGSGTIDPASQSVDYDGTASFTVTPDTGWSVASVTGDTCNPVHTGGTSWEAANIQADCAVEASFAINTFTVTATTASGNGTIDPASQSVDYDGTASFTVTPDPGWSLASVTGDTCSPVNTTGTTWEATNIQADCAVEASFAINSYNIGGTVAGLDGDGLELALNGGIEILPIAGNGAFQFSTELDHDTDYTVTVESQPTDPNQTCTIANATGTVNAADVNDIEVTCSTDTFTVGGTVTGLEGDQVVLQNNGGDDQVVTADGGFTFSAQADGSDYNVTVVTQPSDPSQTCTVANATGTLAGADVTNVDVNCSTDQFTVGGTVTGLEGDQVVLQNNGGDDQVVTADGGFTFSAQADGSDYNVTVLTQPSDPSQTCTVANGAGTLAGADVTNVDVNCSTDQFTVGGTVTGLEGDQVVLQNNGGDDQVVTADGGFTFTAQADGSDYNITVLTQPDGQQCTVTNGSGTLAGDNVTSVEVDCTTIEIGFDFSEIDFGNVPVTQSASRTVTIRNGGDPDLIIDHFDPPGSPFTFDPGSCAPLPRTLAAGESCTVEVGFEPTLAGDFSDALGVDSNAGSSPDSVALRGSALAVIPVPVLGPLGLLLLIVLTGLAARPVLLRR